MPLTELRKCRSVGGMKLPQSRESTRDRGHVRIDRMKISPDWVSARRCALGHSPSPALVALITRAAIRLRRLGSTAMDTVSNNSGLMAADQIKVPTPGGEVAIKIRLMAIAAAARFHGAELHQSDLRSAADETPSPAALTDWLR